MAAQLSHEVTADILTFCENADLTPEESHLHLLAAVRSLTPSVEMSCEVLRMIQPKS